MYVLRVCLTITYLVRAHFVSCAPSDTNLSKPQPRSTNQANLTHLLTSIPSDFNIERHFELPIPYLSEACFVNIIAVLRDAASGDFAGSMPIANYRSTRFLQPLIKINSPNMADIQRKYLVWGLFLTAYHLHIYNEFHLSFFSLRWKGDEVGIVGVGGPIFGAGVTNSLHTTTPSPTNDFQISHAYFGTQVIRKGAVFMTIASALMEAAPPPLYTRIQSTWINYMQNEPCAFFVTPSEVARTAAGPFFTNEDLIDVLTKATDYFAQDEVYRQMEMNVSVAGAVIAQAVFLHRSNPAFLELAGINGTEHELDVA
ncbi:MAG: hypothetical protein LQ343_007068 [Gyalolechia ehrenbergii]|nr:MAG: hypothetical protein LQ343_007068 [Gyalolechia ehrenbergii]